MISKRSIKYQFGAKHTGNITVGSFTIPSLFYGLRSVPKIIPACLLFYGLTICIPALRIVLRTQGCLSEGPEFESTHLETLVIYHLTHFDSVLGEETISPSNWYSGVYTRGSNTYFLMYAEYTRTNTEHNEIAIYANTYTKHGF